MTFSTLAPASVTGSPTAGAPTAVAPAESSLAGTFDGLSWVYRPGSDRLLHALTADAWRDPAAQGWQRVKLNARREVWRAVILNTPYYLKYYFCRPVRGFFMRLLDRSACRDEYDGGLFALRSGIPAVRPVAYTLNARCGSRTCAILITEAVEPALPLNEFWLQLQSDRDTPRRRRDTASLAELLAQTIARSHQAGFEHLDMHVANILVQPTAPRRYRTLFIDLHSARRGVPISDRAVVRNLAQLNQWFRKHSTTGDRLRFLRAYLRWRDEYEHTCEHSRPLGLSFTQLVTALDTAARKHAHKLGTRRDHRVLRDGRYFTKLKLAGGWRGMAVACCKQPTQESAASRLVFERDWWQRQLADPLRWFRETPEVLTCKDSHSAAVCRAILPHPGGPVPVIIKRPRARNWRRALARLWPPSRSTRGWRMGHALLHRDVATARPLAVLERRWGPFVRDSLLITEALPDAVDLEAYLRQQGARRTAAEWYALKRDLCARLVAKLQRLQERGFDHRDCKASNILVLASPPRKLMWIDMDGLRYAGPLSHERRCQPLVRLHVSLLGVPGLTRTDRVRFLKDYFTCFGSKPEAWRQVWRELSRTAEEKIRAKATRREWKLKHYGRE